VEKRYHVCGKDADDDGHADEIHRTLQRDTEGHYRETQRDITERHRGTLQRDTEGHYRETQRDITERHRGTLQRDTEGHCR